MENVSSDNTRPPTKLTQTLASGASIVALADIRIFDEIMIVDDESGISNAESGISNEDDGDLWIW